MSREDRRAENRARKNEEKKKSEALKWLNSLPKIKKDLLDSFINITVNNAIQHLIDSLERCYTAAIIQEVPTLELDEIERIWITGTNLLTEDKDTVRKVKKECKGDIEMAMKKVNGQEESVKERVIELISEGLNQKKSVEILKSEFPMLSVAMITNAYKKTKNMLANKSQIKELKSTDEDVQAAINYIFEENSEKSSKKESEKVESLAPKEEVSKENEVKEMKESKLKVIKEVTKVIARDIEGEHGVYHVEGNICEVNGEYSFTNKDEVVDWAAGNIKDLNKQIEVLKNNIRLIEDNIGHIESCKDEAVEVIETYLN